jgi:hypothetical protein
VAFDIDESARRHKVIPATSRSVGRSARTSHRALRTAHRRSVPRLSNTGRSSRRGASDVDRDEWSISTKRDRKVPLSVWPIQRPRTASPHSRGAGTSTLVDQPQSDEAYELNQAATRVLLRGRRSERPPLCKARWRSPSLLRSRPEPSSQKWTRCPRTSGGWLRRGCCCRCRRVRYRGRSCASGHLENRRLAGSQ